MARYLIPTGMVLLCAGGMLRAQDDAWTGEQLKFFEAKIRPVLVEHCYACHSTEATSVAGGLYVDSRAGLMNGGDSGPAIEPGNVDDSLLIMALRYDDPDLAMPPKKSGGQLPADVIADFEKWVKMGAPDPRKGESVQQEFGADEEAKNWWAFQPLKLGPIPQPMNSAWSESPVDRFVLARLESEGLEPVADAEPLVLLRRLYFDLIGLPPSVKEAQQFAADWKMASDETARAHVLAQTVDRLLASPQFGERWGRHWLDVARYSESSGKDVNILYPLAWRYRDYVIDSFNADVPYNVFVRQQIAGDLLQANSDQERANNLVATGFLAIGPKSLNEMNGRQFAADIADEQIDAVTQGFLGLTVACARCHDHKFDPISQVDYTALAGIFLSTDTRYGTTGGVGGRNAGGVLDLPRGSKSASLPAISADEYEQMQRRLEALQAEQRELFAERQRSRRSGKPGDDGFNLLRVATQIGQIQTDLRQYNSDGTPKALAIGAVDKPRTAPSPNNLREQFNRRQRGQFVTLTDSPLFVRGEVDRPSDKVRRAIPEILAGVESPTIQPTTSGRRELAQWVTDPANPLTSRVVVNRVWHWLFGAGIVASVDNFGTTGDVPSHPELLDHLASQFMANGWSIKQLIREIVLSRTYRLASTYDERNYAADPSNALLWRHSPRRLEAEAIRDSMMSAAGTLELERPVASLIGRAGDGPLGGPRRMRLSEDAVAKANDNHRSVYLAVARNAEPDILATFDFPDAAAVQGARQVTNVPSQSLFLLNSDFAAKQARALAHRVTPVETKMAEKPRLDTNLVPKQLEQLYWLALSRSPTSDEESAARKLLSRYRSDPLAGWTSVARAVLASAEFRSVD